MNSLVEKVPADEMEEQEAQVKQEATPKKSTKTASTKGKDKAAAAPAKQAGKRSRGK